MTTVRQLLQARASQVWTTRPDASVFEALQLMADKDVGALPVVQGVRLVGIDSMNIDDTRGNSRPVHSTLLRADILIAEHLCNLGNVPDASFTFTALPPKFKGVGTFPVRAFARLK